MELNDDTCYKALTARDRRFDGLFFVAVKTTGIYCRPVCTAKTPRRARCLFFTSAALAEKGGFRPCLRCRPELAPGHAPIDSAPNLARVAQARIHAGATLEDIAQSLGIGQRQLRRIVKNQLGVSPVELAQTHRLLLAKRLIAETSLPMTQVALAAGFNSIRRFNALFQSHYRLTPSELKRAFPQPPPNGSLRLALSFRPPLDWPAMMAFLGARAIPGVESVIDDTYHRTVQIGDHHGWLTVRFEPDRHLLLADVSTSLTPVLSAVLARLRNLFDLDARPDLIAAHLAMDPQLAPHIRRTPGLRMPGAFDGFELALRAILGQQVSVRAATTLAGRFAATFGQPATAPIAGLTRFTPSAQAIMHAHENDIAGLGLPGARARSLQNLASLVALNKLDLQAGADPARAINQLIEQPGIGPWTAQYIAMRALRWPDAFPTGDLGLLKSLGLTSKKQLEQAAEKWRPWRSYAVMHLWASLSSPTTVPG